MYTVVLFQDKVTIVLTQYSLLPFVGILTVFRRNFSSLNGSSECPKVSNKYELNYLESRYIPSLVGANLSFENPEVS